MRETAERAEGWSFCEVERGVGEDEHQRGVRRSNEEVRGGNKSLFPPPRRPQRRSCNATYLGQVLQRSEPRDIGIVSRGRVHIVDTLDRLEDSRVLRDDGHGMQRELDEQWRLATDAVGTREGQNQQSLAELWTGQLKLTNRVHP